MASVEDNRVSKIVINTFMVDVEASGARIWSWRRRWREESQDPALWRFAELNELSEKLTFIPACRAVEPYRRLSDMHIEPRASVWLEWRD